MLPENRIRHVGQLGHGKAFTCMYVFPHTDNEWEESLGNVKEKVHQQQLFIYLIQWLYIHFLFDRSGKIPPRITIYELIELGGYYVIRIKISVEMIETHAHTDNNGD